jgi:hypothetical protein
MESAPIAIAEILAVLAQTPAGLEKWADGEA